MSLRLYQRSMKWRKERDDKVRAMRTEAEADPDRAWSLHVTATSADHIQSYWEYNRLVGESDGGVLLDERAYEDIRAKAREAAKNRLFVTWTNRDTGMDCYNVGPDSRCFCGHSYKAHAWYNTESKEVHCRCPGCKCRGFDYVAGHGSWWIRCSCKHAHDEHRVDGVMGRCRHARCTCAKFYSPFSCACGDPWAQHSTVVQNLREWRRSGKPSENLVMGDAGGTAAANGAVTRFTSLLPGVDRARLEAGEALPFTDHGVVRLGIAGSMPEGAGVGSGAGSGEGVRGGAILIGGGGGRGGARELAVKMDVAEAKAALQRDRAYRRSGRSDAGRGAHTWRERRGRGSDRGGGDSSSHGPDRGGGGVDVVGEAEPHMETTDFVATAAVGAGGRWLVFPDGREPAFSDGYDGDRSAAALTTVAGPSGDARRRWSASGDGSGLCAAASASAAVGARARPTDARGTRARTHHAPPVPRPARCVPLDSGNRTTTAETTARGSPAREACAVGYAAQHRAARPRSATPPRAPAAASHAAIRTGAVHTSSIGSSPDRSVARSCEPSAATSRTGRPSRAQLRRASTSSALAGGARERPAPRTGTVYRP